jgi:alpha-glucosidase (family GH31 glycosyl hydrolase)
MYISFQQVVNKVKYILQNQYISSIFKGHENEILQENSVYKELGVTSLCYFNPYISTSYTKLFNECLENDYFLKNNSNQPYLFPYFGDVISRHFFVGSIDFSNKNASNWYQQQIQQSFDLGYNGFMLDFGEYTPVDSISSNGKDGHEMHNYFIELYQKTVYDMTINSTSIERLLHLSENETNNLSLNYQSDFIFHTRSGYTNSARNTQLHWTGDASADWNPYSGLPAHVQACLGVGISGVPYCSSSIGGYVCEFYPDLTVELLTRWLQVGTFSGFMHDETEGSACTQERVQIFTNNQTEYVWRKYAKLRTQLFPYIFTLAHEAHATGLPITRHHLLTYYNDDIAIQQEYQYTFGNDLLVAPIVHQNQFVQDVYLPIGESWIDLSTDLSYDDSTDGRYRIARSEIVYGGQWIMNVKADLLTIPLFARAGSIIPLIDPSVFTLNHGQPISIYDRSYILHLWIFLNEQNQANGLVWDGLNIQINSCNLNKSLCIDIDDPLHRLLILQLPFDKPASSVLFNSTQPFERVDNWQTVAKILPKEQLENCFTYDEEKQVIWIAIVLLQQSSLSFHCQIDF